MLHQHFVGLFHIGNGARNGEGAHDGAAAHVVGFRGLLEELAARLGKVAIAHQVGRRLGPDAASLGETDADTRASASCSDLHRANSLAFNTPSRSVSDDVPDPVAITSPGGIL